MNIKRIESLRNFYKDGLLQNTMKFWSDYSIDRKYGGFITYIDRKGEAYCEDKPIWIQGRGVWMFSKLFNDVEQKQDWIEIAKNGIEFILRHGFDRDGKMFFLTTRDGLPLRKRRYLFSEAFTIIALAEYGVASNDYEMGEKAKALYKNVLDCYRMKYNTQPKYIQETRQMKSHAMTMILIAISQEIRKMDKDSIYDEVIDQSLVEIFEHFYNKDYDILLETVGHQGEFLNNPMGRCVNPGHAIESSWFIMEEGKARNDKALIKKALHILDRSLEIGWDKEYGGLLYFVDIEGKPLEQLEWDMKLWWPHTEALYALLLAYSLTGDDRYFNWYEKVHEWTYKHFPDEKYGEWFGYLHRDGTISLDLKGNMWKGIFHLPRMQLLCWKLLDQMLILENIKPIY